MAYLPSSTRHESTPRRFSVSSPPARIRADCPRGLEDFVDEVAVYAADIIQREADANPARMFMYNVCASNDWNNADYENVVLDSLEFIFLCMMNDNRATIHQVMESVVPKMVVYHVAYHAVRGQDEVFRNIRDEELIRELLIGDEEFAKFKRTLGDWVRSRERERFFDDVERDMESARRGGSDRRDYRDDRDRDRGRGGVGEVRRYQPESRRTPFQSDRRDSRRESGRPSAAAASRPTPPEPTRRTTARPEQPYTRAAEPVEKELVMEEELEWRESETQRYQIVYNPAKTNVQLVKQKGEVLQELTALSKEDMDRKAHEIPTVFGTRPTQHDALDAVEMISRFSKAVEDTLNKQASVYAVNGAGDVVPGTAPSAMSLFDITDVNLESAWSQALVTAALTKNRGFDIMSGTATINTPIVLQEAYDQEALTRLVKSTSFSEARDKLRILADSMPAGLWYAIDRTLTKAVNKVLNNNIGVTAGIESFTTDIFDVIEHLRSVYGNKVADAFVENERWILERALILPDTEDTSLHDQVMFSTVDMSKEDPKPLAAYLCQHVSLTYLRCKSYDLSIKFEAGRPAMLLEDQSPALYRLAKHLLDQTNPVNRGLWRHYLQTSDHRTLELHLGFMARDAYLVSLVD